MTKDELHQLRKMIIDGDQNALKDIFINHRKNCIHTIRTKLFYSKEDAEDIYTDAILVFRDNVISGKIENLTSVNGYLKSTCLNMGKTKITYDKKKSKKKKKYDHFFMKTTIYFMRTRPTNNNSLNTHKKRLRN